MLKLRTSLLKNKFILFVIIIFIVGLVSGFLYYNMLDKSIISNINDKLLNYLSNNKTNYNNTIIHVLLISLILLFSYVSCGFILGLFTIFYEGMSIGLLLTTSFNILGIKGLIYAIIKTAITKTIFLVLLILMIYKSFNVTRRLIGYIIYKKDKVLKELIIKDTIRIIKISLIIICNEIIIIYIGNKILNIFSFLI